MIVVVTALIGAAESVVPPPRSQPGVRYVCVTDRADVRGWERLPASNYQDPRRAARLVKTSVHEMFPGLVTVWLDASFELLVHPKEIIEAAVLTGCSLVGFVHPDRSRICDEAEAILRSRLAPQPQVMWQLQAYQDEGFDTAETPQTVLTTTGVLVRWPTPEVIAFNRLWQRQVLTHTVRDQLSVDYCAWRTGVRIGYLPGHYRDNSYVRYDRARHCQGRRLAS